MGTIKNGYRNENTVNELLNDSTRFAKLLVVRDLLVAIALKEAYEAGMSELDHENLKCSLDLIHKLLDRETEAG